MTTMKSGNRKSSRRLSGLAPGNSGLRSRKARQEKGLPSDLTDHVLDLWSRRVSARIAAKTSDARAHAAARPLAERRPPADAARARLDELLDDLAGASNASSLGLLRDAREEFLRDSSARWLPLVPDRLRAGTDPGPSSALVHAARTLELHGLDLRRELEVPVADAQRRLAAAVVLSASGRASVDLLDAWERAATATITRSALLTLGDARIALDRIAGRALIHPDHLDDSPLELEPGA